jgi:peroxiredoxin family protein
MGENNGTRKLAIICSKGTLDMAYPGLVLANAARQAGIEAFIFFTFWGMDIITTKKMNKLKVTPVGNPAMGMPNLVGLIPGMTPMATSMMKKKIDGLDIPPVDEFLEMIHDAGAKLYACRMAADMMGLEEADLIPQIEGIISAMDFMDLSENAQTIFI